MKSMKSSRIMTEIPKKLRIPSNANQIKVCDSQEQFFTTKNHTRILRNPEIICKKLQGLTLNFKTPNKITVQDQEQTRNSGCIAAKTDDTVNQNSPIQFRPSKTIKKHQIDDNLTCTVEFTHETYPKIPKRMGIIPSKPQKKIVIEDFVIIKKIGEGSYSEVFSAIQQRSGFLCSLKRISKKLIKEQFHLVEVLMREIKIQSHLNHKNLVDLYGVFDDSENIYLILEYCPGGNLYELLKKKRRICEQMSLEEISSLLRQICCGIQSMHSQYLMHRDIKPENIFFTLGNEVKIGDFGWSVFYGNHGMRNTQCGTPLYLAPELVGKQQYSETVDIWAIGILAYELLTGDNPFNIHTAKDLQKVLQKQIDFSDIQDDVAQDFVKKLLQKDTDLRLQIEDVLAHQFLSEK